MRNDEGRGDERICSEASSSVDLVASIQKVTNHQIIPLRERTTDMEIDFPHVVKHRIGCHARQASRLQGCVSCFHVAHHKAHGTTILFVVLSVASVHPGRSCRLAAVQGWLHELGHACRNSAPTADQSTEHESSEQKSNLITVGDMHEMTGIDRSPNTWL